MFSLCMKTDVCNLNIITITKHVFPYFICFHWMLNNTSTPISILLWYLSVPVPHCHVKSFSPTCTIFFEKFCYFPKLFCYFAGLNWPVILLNTAPTVGLVVLRHLTTSESLQKTGCGQKALFVAGCVSHVEHKWAFSNIANQHVFGFFS